MHKIWIYFRINESRKPRSSDVPPNTQPSPSLILRAEPTVTSILKVQVTYAWLYGAAFLLLFIAHALFWIDLHKLIYTIQCLCICNWKSRYIWYWQTSLIVSIFVILYFNMQDCVLYVMSGSLYVTGNEYRRVLWWRSMLISKILGHVWPYSTPQDVSTMENLSDAICDEFW